VIKTLQITSVLFSLFFLLSFSGKANKIEVADTIQFPTLDLQIIDTLATEPSSELKATPEFGFTLEEPPLKITIDTLGLEDEDDFFMDGESADELEEMQLGEMLREFVVPFHGKVTSRFGMRRRRMHMGTDVNLNTGDTVVAAYHGIVKMAQTYYRYGKLVILEHPLNLETYYAHFSQILVNEGDTVQTGQPIGLGGRTGRATGPHLHFEIRQNGKAYNPELVFDFENNFVREHVADKESLQAFIQTPQVVGRAVTDRGDVPQVHVVRRGDTLGAIARRYRTTVNQLCRLNNIRSTTTLRIGMRLRLY